MMLTNFDRLHRIGDTAMKRVMKKLFLIALVAVSVCAPEFVSATHLIGGDLRYRCLGNNQYEITLTYRRDCLLGDPGTEFEDTASIGFFNLTTNAPLQFIGPNGLFRMRRNPIDTATQLFINDCTLAGNDLCIEQTNYVDTIILLPFVQGYRIVYQRCCRNSSLNNVNDPLNTGMTLVADLSFAAQQVCNSSPVLGDYPPIYICVDKDINFLFEATDPDGDSLVYELFTPFLGASDNFPKPSPPPQPPYIQINWETPPYSLMNLLGGVPLEIDRFTGQITGTPNLIGQFLVGIKIRSYRDGELIEITTREWQYNVRACRDQPIADFIVSTELNCDNLTIDFTQQSQFAFEYQWTFDYGNPNSATSTELNPSYTYPEPGFYTVALIVNEPDSICFDTAFVTIGVFESDVSAGFQLDVPTCDESILIDVLDLSDDPDPGYDVTSWQYILSDGTFSDTSALQNPQFVIDETTSGLNLTLIATSSNGCTATYDTTFDVNIILIDFKGDTVGVCDGDSVELFNNPGSSDFTFVWSPTDNLDLTNPANPIAFPGMTTTYSVTVSDGLCEVTGSAVVAVQELPILAFITETDCRSLVLSTTNSSQGGFNFIWNFGDDSTSTENSPIHTYDDEGVYQVTLASDDGCDVSISRLITISVITEEVEDVSISCFAEPVTLNPDASPDYFYQWSPGQFLSDSLIGSPVAEVDATTIFTVTITDLEFPGCSVIEEVQVLVPPDFDFGAPSDSAYCDGPPVALSGSNPDLNYDWFNIDGELLFEGQVFVIAPQSETTYIIVGTDSFGCSKEDTITLSPTFFDITLDTGSDTVICFGEEVILSVTNNDPTQNLTYLWEPANMIDSGQGTPTPTVSPESDQVFTVQIENAEVGCVTSAQVEVLVSLFQFEYSPSVLTCINVPLELGIGNLDTTDLTFMWSPEEFIEDGENTSSPTVNPPATTVFTVTITDNYGCMTTADVTVTVSTFVPEDLVIFVNQDTIILGDTIFHLSTNQDPLLDFQWEGEGIIPPSDAPEIFASPSTEGVYTYTVTVTNADGCELIGQVQGLTVLDPLCNDETVFIPDAFSPNGDGDNDLLEVYSNFIESMELRIYNRWGEEVFVALDQNTKWDGTFRGKELAPDVFGYYLRVICIPNKPYFRKGNITLFK